MDLDSTLRGQLDQMVAANKVVLFMKGDRQQPQCGFSAKVVGTLDVLLEDYQTVNVIENEEVREGIKVYSDWPTIPQLYIDGEFAGGCDIVEEMAASGELPQLLGLEAEIESLPEISLTPAAAEEIRSSLPESGAALRLTMTTDYRPDLSVGQSRSNDISIDSEGVALLIDPFSAKRADGLVIDFQRQGFRSGFVMSNSKHAAVKELEPSQLKSWMDEGQSFELVDVRPPSERALAELPNSRNLDSGIEALLSSLVKDQPVVLYCHIGIRSRALAPSFTAAGFCEVYNLTGGINAWATSVDRTIRRY